MPGGKLRRDLEIAWVGPLNVQRLSPFFHSTETRGALQNLILIETYINAFLDQTLNQESSPLLENAVDHPAATVERYAH
jgi:hypothetical protein